MRAGLVRGRPTQMLVCCPRQTGCPASRPRPWTASGMFVMTPTDRTSRRHRGGNAAVDALGITQIVSADEKTFHAKRSFPCAVTLYRIALSGCIVHEKAPLLFRSEAYCFPFRHRRKNQNVSLCNLRGTHSKKHPPRAITMKPVFCKRSIIPRIQVNTPL